MDPSTEGRVQKGKSKTARTGRKRRPLPSDEVRQRLREIAASRPRGPDGRFLPHAQKKECTICTESKRPVLYPSARISGACAHDPGACLDCVQNSIKADFDTKQWTEISCPECVAHLNFGAMAKYADAATFARYDQILLQLAVREVPGFTWCPLEGCTSGQINEPGEDCPGEPISAVCELCKKTYCIKHNMGWHDPLTCEEFDIVLQGPSEAADQGEYEYLRAKMDQPKLKEMERQAEDRRQAALSEKMIQTTTKTCPQPGCGWHIAKVGGCYYMSCTGCDTDFCWDCGALLDGEGVQPPVDPHDENCRHHRNHADQEDAMDGYGEEEPEEDDDEARDWAAYQRAERAERAQQVEAR